MGGMTVVPDRLAGDLGWGLAVTFRAYVKAADAATAGMPGGHRGYQVLCAAARDEPGSQAAMAQRLGIDRTVMTYLLDDLEAAKLVERQPDPADRRSRRHPNMTQFRVHLRGDIVDRAALMQVGGVANAEPSSLG